MDITRYSQFAIITIYSIIFYIIFNYFEDDNDGLFINLISSTFLSLFVFIILCFIITLMLILTFYRYYDYEDLFETQRRMRRH